MSFLGFSVLNSNTFSIQLDVIFMFCANHKNSIKNNKPEVSTFAKHVLDQSHEFDSKSVGVLAQETDYSKISILEMLHYRRS